jgi:protocatechuate 3,4-dioxygenase beta subunit
MKTHSWLRNRPVGVTGLQTELFSYRPGTNRRMDGMFRLVVRTWLGLTLALSAWGQTNSPLTVRFKGIVVDPEGRPVDGAVVESYSNSRLVRMGGAREPATPQRAVTTNGTFELQLPRDGVVILARKAGWAPVWRQFWNMIPESEERLVLSRPSFLAGVVVDEANKPLTNAEVAVFLASMEVELEGGRRTMGYLNGEPAGACFKTRTSADGRFRIEGFPTNAAADLTVRFPGKALRLPVREFLDPSSLLGRAGQDDIRLVVEPAGTVEGKIVADVPGQSFPTARISLQASGPRFFGTGEEGSTESRADATFRFSNVAAGQYQLRAIFGTNPVPEWVAETVPVSVEAGQTAGGLQLNATRGGVLEVVTLAKKDRQPLAQVYVNAYKNGYQVVGVSSSAGKTWLRLPAGDYQLSAHRENEPSENRTATVEADKTNTVELELSAPSMITGVIRGPDGQPAAGVTLRIVGGYADYGRAAPKSDTNGHFELLFDPRRYGRADMTFCLVARDPERNLAVAQDIDEDTGPLDLRLASAMSMAGRVECEGKPVTNATAALVFWAGNSGMHLSGLAMGTNTPGRFEIPALPLGRRYGLSVSAPGYGQKHVNAIQSETEPKRIELNPIELKPANLKLAGQVTDVDDKPVAGVSVNLNGDDQPNGVTRTDRDGRFQFDRVCAGPLRLFANVRNLQGNISAVGGDTNVILKLGQSSAYSPGATVGKLKGVVTDAEGKPVSGAQVAVFPSPSNRTRTGTNGAFSLTWTLQRYQVQQGRKPCLVVRDLGRNLAAAEDFSEGTTNLDVQLGPALTVAGRVEGPDGTSISDAQVGVWLSVAQTYSEVNEQPARTDSRGSFEIKAMPFGQKYRVYASAKDHGRVQQDLGDSSLEKLELPTFVLPLADQRIAGQVLNEQDKPVSGAYVSMSGKDQPAGSSTTDSKGRFSFKVCDGTIRLFVSGSSGSANMSAEAGDTNVTIQLASNSRSGRAPGTSSSTTPRSIRNFTPFGFAPEAAPADKPLLLCLFDAEQAPSRRLAGLLAKQYDSLRQKGIAVLGIQAAVIPVKTWETWTNSNPLPFPLGRAMDKSNATRWATEVSSLPRLILRNGNGTVAAEGFRLDELDGKLGALQP